MSQDQNALIIKVSTQEAEKNLDSLDKKLAQVEDRGDDASKSLDGFGKKAKDTGKNTKELDQQLGKTEDGFDELADSAKDAGNEIESTGEKSKKAEKKLSDMHKNLLSSAKALGGSVAAATAMVGGFFAVASSAAEADVQIQILANRANTNIKSFQALSHASAILGVSQDQLGSILADTQEKLGEFTASEAGGAGDFFDVLRANTKLTEDQIRSLGKTISGKDGVDAIITLKDELSNMGATSQEQRFVMESLASDLGNLMGIFADGGQVLKEYEKELELAGAIRSQEAIDNSIKLAAQQEALRLRFTGVKNELANAVMPVMNDLLSVFMDGIKDGGDFGDTLSTIKDLARGVGYVVIGTTGVILGLVEVMKGFVRQAQNIAETAEKFAMADGFIDKAKAIGEGFKGAYGVSVDTTSNLFMQIDKNMKLMDKFRESSIKQEDSLVSLIEKNIKQQNERNAGLQTTVKQHEAETKALEAKAKAQEKLNNLGNGFVSNSNLSGLKIKSRESIAGGQVKGYTAEFAQISQSLIGDNLKYFSAFNDTYHQGKNSKHNQGQAFDIVLKNAKDAKAAVSELTEAAKKYGYQIKVLDEYAKPSANATGGHLHVSVLGRTKANQNFNDLKSDASMLGKITEDYKKEVDAILKAQADVRSRYMTEDLIKEKKHQQALEDIRKFFGDSEEGIALAEKEQKKYKLALELEQKEREMRLESYKWTEEEKIRKQAEFDALKIRATETIAERVKEIEIAGINARTQYELEQLAKVKGQRLIDAQGAYASIVGDFNSRSAMRGMTSKQRDIKSLDNQLDSDVGSMSGAYLDSLNAMQEYEKLIGSSEEAIYEKSNAMYEDFRKQKLELLEYYNELESEMRIGHIAADYEAASMLFGGMADLAKGYAGESSKAYKILITAQKAANMTSVLMNNLTAISGAWASAPFPYNLGNVALTIAKTGVLEAAISAISPNITGMAHDGIANIPKEGTWLLDGGERIVNPQQNNDLTDYLAEQRKAQREQRSGSTSLNQRIIASMDSGVMDAWANSPEGEQALKIHFSNNISEYRTMMQG